MRPENMYMMSSIVIIISVLCMIFNFLLMPLNINFIRVLGVIMIIDIIALIYSTVQLKKK
jgi:hypothetical protein